MLILTIVQLDITLEFLFFFSFYFVYTSACNCECMQRRGQVKLLPFDPKPERTLHRLRREQRKAHQRDQAIMQNNEERDHG